MQWIAPSEKAPDDAALEKRLWAGAGRKQSTEPVLVLIVPGNSGSNSLPVLQQLELNGG